MSVDAVSRTIVTAEPPGSLERRLAIGASWSVIGAVVSRGLTLAASIAAGRLLGTMQFGELGMIQSTQGLFGILAGAGMGLAATKFVAEFRTVDASKTQRFIGFALLVAIASTALLGTVLLLFSGMLAERVLHASHLTLELQIATGLLVFGTINGVQNGAIIGLGNFRTVAMLNILRGVAFCVLSVTGILIGGLTGGVIGLVLTELVAVLASQFVLQQLFPGLRPRRPVDEASWREFRSMCHFSLLALCGSVCFTLVLWLTNVWLVSERDGYAALGIFNAADRWRQLILFLPATLSPLILSTLSQLHGENSQSEYRRLVWWNVWVTLLVVTIPAAVVAVGAPWGMLVFGEDYRAGWMTLAILSLSSIAVVLNNVLGQILVSQGGIRSRFLLDVFLSLVLGGTSWLLIPAFRDLGMAWSNLLAYGATAAALVICVFRSLKNPKVVEATP